MISSSTTAPFVLVISTIHSAPPKMHNFLYALTLSNINRFLKFFHCQNQEKICNNTITKDHTTPKVCSYTTLWNVTECGKLLFDLSHHWLVASLDEMHHPATRRTHTLNIWCKNCRMWQLLWKITDTLNTFPVVNFLKCAVREFLLFSICL